MLNNVGPTILDGASVCFLVSGPAGSPFAAGASWLSFVWSASLENHGTDATVSLTTSTFGTLTKNPKRQLQLALLQLGYDVLLSSEDPTYEKNENNATAEADNTRVTNKLLQSVVREIWGTGLSPQEMWDEMHKDSDDDDDENTD